MPARRVATLDLKSRREWRQWLARHHDSEAGVWLVFHKRHTGVSGIDYEDAVAEALCFGWVDSLVKRLDDARYARKFTPRKPDSKWSTANRRRYEKLEAQGRLAAPGRQRTPTDRSGDAPRSSVDALPGYIEQALRRNTRAWKHFEQLAPSYRRAYIAWIDSAKREETKRKRMREAVGLLAAGKKLGLK
jgi:uncharacterized protein YdeI (YjbR/CyaY-like superfamily)